jgi:hypothetical protein
MGFPGLVAPTDLLFARSTSVCFSSSRGASTSRSALRTSGTQHTGAAVQGAVGSVAALMMSCAVPQPPDAARIVAVATTNVASNSLDGLQRAPYAAPGRMGGSSP